MMCVALGFQTQCARRWFEIAEERQNLPQSTAGLTRYFDEEEGGFRITPEQVVIVSAAIVVLELLLRLSII